MEDFKPKYKNVNEIKEDLTLSVTEQTTELVKHYSMCLFGLAADIGDYTGKLAERDTTIAKLRRKILNLQVQNARLRKKLGGNVSDEDELDKLQEEIISWRNKANILKSHYEKLKKEVNKNGK
ncbi:MAG: hypothetical protein NC350_00225 [Corallococcus sp.]|nr:hypothetical protein [Corallococcus sp.]